MGGVRILGGAVRGARESDTEGRLGRCAHDGGGNEGVKKKNEKEGWVLLVSGYIPPLDPRSLNR
jgi:hypothetical protein